MHEYCALGWIFHPLPLCMYVEHVSFNIFVLSGQSHISSKKQEVKVWWNQMSLQECARRMHIAACSVIIAQSLLLQQAKALYTLT